MPILEHGCRALIAYYGFKKNRISFLAGAVLGASWGIYYTSISSTKEKCHKEEGCGDFFARLSGTPMPAPVTLITGLAIAITHIDHRLLHTYNPFIPLAGWAVGCYSATKTIEFSKQNRWFA